MAVIRRYLKTVIALILISIESIVFFQGYVNTAQFRRRYLTSSSGAELPPHIEKNLIDVSDYFQLWKDQDIALESITPFYWHVAKAGGTTVQDRYLQCFTLIAASEIGGISHENDEFLRIVHKNGSTNHINVDVSIFEGIERAKDLHLVPSHIAQVVFSPLFDESVQYLFEEGEENKGIMFAMFRHPVDRVVSLFYYLRQATWEPTYNPALANMTLGEYANSPLVEANFVLRSLVNKFTGPLSPDDLNMAKEILRRKCIVGIVEEFKDSVNRFDSYLGLEPNVSVYAENEINYDTRQDYVQGCEQNLRDKGGSNKHSHPKLDKDSEVYEVLQRKNGWDMELWTFIRELYAEQKLQYGDGPNASKEKK